jgi:uncharacterized membrane protein YgcG
MGAPTLPVPPQESGGTTTLLDPRLAEGDRDGELFHYVRKDKIAESAVLGSTVTALCGATFPVTRTPKPGSPVCPACKEMLGMLRSFGGGDSGGGDTGGGDSGGG